MTNLDNSNFQTGLSSVLEKLKSHSAKLGEISSQLGQEASKETSLKEEKPATFVDVNGQRGWTGGMLHAGQLEGVSDEMPEVTDPLGNSKDVVGNIVTKSLGASSSTPPDASKVPTTKGAMEEAKKEYEQDVATLEETIEGRPSTIEERESLMERYEVGEYLQQVNALRPQVAKLQGDIDMLTVQEANQASLLEEKLASRPAIDQAKNVMAREYDRKRSVLAAQLGAQAALMEAYQGNLDSARQLVNESLDAWVYDQELALQDINSLMNVHRDWYESLKDDYKEELAESKAQLEKEEVEIKENIKMKQDMMIDAASKGIDLGWGASDLKEMDLLEATKRYVNKVAPEMKDEDSTNVAILKKEYDEAIESGAISSNVSFSQFYQMVTGYGETDLSRVAQLSQEYQDLARTGATGGLTEAEYIAQQLGIDLSSFSSGGFAGAQDKWTSGKALNADEIALFKDRIFSLGEGETVPDELAEMIRGGFDIQLDSPLKNADLATLLQVRYRIDSDILSPQEIYDQLHRELTFSNIPAEQLNWATRMNGMLRDEYLARRSAKSKSFWAKLWGKVTAEPSKESEAQTSLETAKTPQETANTYIEYYQDLWGAE
jgi:hypothetical protein